MQDINSAIANYCLDHQEKFSDCQTEEELKTKLDQVIDTIGYAEFSGILELDIGQLLAKETILDEVDTDRIAKEFFDYLEQVAP